MVVVVVLVALELAGTTTMIASFLAGRPSIEEGRAVVVIVVVVVVSLMMIGAILLLEYVTIVGRGGEQLARFW